MVMVDVDVDGSCQLSVDSQPKSTGLVWGWRPPGVVIIIIIIIIINSHRIIIKKLYGIYDTILHLRALKS